MEESPSSGQRTSVLLWTQDAATRGQPSSSSGHLPSSGLQGCSGYKVLSRTVKASLGAQG